MPTSRDGLGARHCLVITGLTTAERPGVTNGTAVPSRGESKSASR